MKERGKVGFKLPKKRIGIDEIKFIAALQKRVKERKPLTQEQKADVKRYEKLGLKLRQIWFLTAYPETLCNISATCRKIGITRRTYYNWLEQSEIFKMESFYVREGVYDDIEEILLQKVMSGDTTAMIYYMKCQMKDRGYFV